MYVEIVPTWFLVGYKIEEDNFGLVTCAKDIFGLVTYGKIFSVLARAFGSSLPTLGLFRTFQLISS